MTSLVTQWVGRVLHGHSLSIFRRRFAVCSDDVAGLGKRDVRVRVRQRANAAAVQQLYRLAPDLPADNLPNRTAIDRTDTHADASTCRHELMPTNESV